MVLPFTTQLDEVRDALESVDRGRRAAHPTLREQPNLERFIASPGLDCVSGSCFAKFFQHNGLQDAEADASALSFFSAVIETVRGLSSVTTSHRPTITTTTSKSG